MGIGSGRCASLRDGPPRAKHRSDRPTQEGDARPTLRITVRSAGTFVWHWVRVRVGDDWRIVGRFDYVV